MPVMNTESIFLSGLSAAFGCGLTGGLAERAKIQVEHLYRSAHFRDLRACPQLSRFFLAAFSCLFMAFIVARTQKGPFLIPLGFKTVAGICSILAENLLLCVSRSDREKRGFTATP